MEVLIGIVIVIAFGALIIVLATKKRGSGGGKGRQKGRAQILRDANRKLAQDPHNPEGLIPLGDLYYNEHDWDKAYPIYETMMSISAAHREIDPFQASLRQGICAVKLNKIQEAFKGLGAAYQINRQNFDVNYYLGVAYFKNNEFDKSVPCFKRCIMLRSDAPGINQYLGIGLYKGKHYKEALPYLKRALDENPENKEALFCMADSMNESGYAEKAMRVFMHMRPDPEFGAKSCLAAGLHHIKMNQADKAMQDFEIGMKHQSAPQDVAVEIRYRYATACFMQNAITKGLEALREIQAIIPNYKDVASLLSRYSELNQNKNLQTYLMAASSDFVALCRKVALRMYKKGTARIMDISVSQDNVQIQLHVDFTRSEEDHIFRFYRTQGTIGELVVREFLSRVNDVKADKGICVSAGTYSDEARRFAEGRPLDLVEKDELIKMLKRVD